MKKLLTSLILLSSSVCFADVAVYSGSQVSSTASEAGARTSVSRIFQVVDLDSQKIVAITLGKTETERTYSVAAAADVVIAAIGAPPGNGRSKTVLAQAGTEIDATSGITTIASFFASGLNAQVVIKGTQATSLPKNLQGIGMAVTTASTSGNPVPASRSAVKSTLNLREEISRAANDAGETLDQAVARVTAGLALKGFVDATAP